MDLRRDATADPFHRGPFPQRTRPQGSAVGTPVLGLFPKIGAEGVYAVGALRRDRALAVKIDDGASRALHAVVLALLVRFGWLDDGARERLASWIDAPLVNRAGIEVGRIETLA